MLKIVVTGPFSAGKTEFIKAVSEIEVVSTERKLTRNGAPGKEETTVAMDYGRTTLKEMTIQLYGTPGQPRFDFMWDILAKEMDGFVVMVDSTDSETFGTAEKLIKLFRSFESVPYIVAANKQDLEGAISPRALRDLLNLEPHVKVAQCIATDPIVIKQILLELTKEI
ncbi:MAG: ATP/GTP-binding protein [Anaerolineae bacterium]|nr:ATP/GTP-binding protein [Anaerolineae bacterium]